MKYSENRIRKVIFKPNKILTLSEKLSIVGQLIGRSKKIVEEDIYQGMLDLNDNKKKITISKLAKLLECSTRTIYRNMGNQLKIEKELLKNGSSMEKVLKVNVYLADLADYKAMNEVYRGRFGKNPPVRTTVATYGGVPGNSLVEIDCIAALD